MLKRTTTRLLAVMMIVLLGGSNLFAQTRIRFPRGSTSTSVSGRLAPGETRSFVLGAKAGQYLTANLSSGNGGVRFNDGGQGTSLQYRTESGNNYIYIVNISRRATPFTLTVSIN